MTEMILPEAPPERWVPLRGVLNFRDVGGYLTRWGAAVAWGRVYRSDCLDEVCSEDVRHLADSIGLQTVVDLRSAVEHSPLAPVCAPTRHEIPLFDLGSDHPSGLAGLDIIDLYWDLLHGRAERVRRVVETVAEAPHPLVFHCTAGKDRTGLVSAVILGILGVSDDDISRDYALTESVLPSILTRLAQRAARADRPMLTLPPQLHTAEAATMRQLLTRVNQEHGSIQGYAFDVGIDRTAIELLRDRLLV